MHHFEYRNGELHAEDVKVADLAREYGTPLYIYSAATLRRHFEAFDTAFEGIEHITCFSAKANGNLKVLSLLGSLGAGADIVSGGELYRALAAGIPAGRIVYSGVGKKEHEIREALIAGIMMFNVESLPELEAIEAVAASMNVKAPISIRINPDVDPQTHPYISTGMKNNKFGLDLDTAYTAYERAAKMEHIECVGIDVHIGSQLTSLDPFLETMDRILAFKERLDGLDLPLKYLDLGGGLGIPYNDEEPPHPTQFGAALKEKLAGQSLTVVLEPGRNIAGNAGILVGQVVYVKTTPHKNFLITDAAMNDLARPSLYGSYHKLDEVVRGGREAKTFDVVGPICESSDFLAKDRELPAMEAGEYLAAFSAGAYGFTMSSQYNARPRAAEVLVDGSNVVLARKRESYEDLIALER